MTVDRCLSFAALLLSLGVFAGCGGKNTFVAPPPPEVDVQKPVIEDTTVFLEFPGRTQAFSRVEIRARVKGFLKTREFQPGQFVKADQLLFTIEPEQFEAAVTAAEGNLEKAKADLEIAEANYLRRKTASEKNQAVSEIDVLSAEADKKAAAAAVDIAEASLADAKRDLSYTRIVTPTEGRVSRDLVDRGNLVGAAEPTLLTTVVQDNPAYFNFEVNERTILPFLKNRPTEDHPEMDGPKDSGDSLRLTLSDGSEYPAGGSFDFIDNTVDSETGTVRVRAVFPNEDGNLADGLFARIGLPEIIKNAVLVPRMAIQRDLGGSFVLVVGPENKVERRVVSPSAFTVGDKRIIEPYDEEKNTGLKRDDRMIISNLQRARAGIEVIPKEANTALNESEPGSPAGSAKAPAAAEQN